MRKGIGPNALGSPAKQMNFKKAAKKASDFAIDATVNAVTGGIGGIMKDKVQSLKNKKNRALKLGVTYGEAYADADKKKYPTKESFVKAAKEYNKKKSPAKQAKTDIQKLRSGKKSEIAQLRKKYKSEKSFQRAMKMQGAAEKAKKSPAKQAKSKKEMRYDKLAQKAENAAVTDKMRKNSRLVDKANKLNKKNNLGKAKLAKG